jgi:CMP-2-keto-3-deoxyoctulosonic acid synthetase
MQTHFIADNKFGCYGQARACRYDGRYLQKIHEKTMVVRISQANTVHELQGILLSMVASGIAYVCAWFLYGFTGATWIQG